MQTMREEARIIERRERGRKSPMKKYMVYDVEQEHRGQKRKWKGEKKEENKKVTIKMAAVSSFCCKILTSAANVY